MRPGRIRPGSRPVRWMWCWSPSRIPRISLSAGTPPRITIITNTTFPSGTPLRECHRVPATGPRQVDVEQDDRLVQRPPDRPSHERREHRPGHLAHRPLPERAHPLNRRLDPGDIPGRDLLKRPDRGQQHLRGLGGLPRPVRCPSMRSTSSPPWRRAKAMLNREM